MTAQDQAGLGRPAPVSTGAALARYAGALAGSVALVTGAGTGIGRAASIALASAGADVALVGRRAGPLDKVAAAVVAAGRRAVALPADVGDAAAVEAAVARAASVLGPADIVVASAGVNAWADIAELDPATLRAALATNVEGVANVVRATLPAMRARAAGRIIVIASDNGRRAEAGGAGYVASKFGAVGLALSLSAELHAAGVNVHLVEPGCVDTPWYPPEEEAPRELMLAPEDVALAVLFLATLPAHIVLEELLLLPRGLLVEPWA
ncbi:MAG: short-chain dehydrogenase/reductase [Chloroflexi bacterium]|nr:short-chain dehydrogenase/reductase [Chloroflexota bacterium]